ncbi:MAG: dihydrolipoamide acetyltransferase family protein [Candidatus Xenobia bacterium]
MSINVVMPQMGESIAEGTLIRWLKKPGDKVERDEPLFEISTDKVDAEIPSPAAGVLGEVKVKEGQTVPVNTVVAIIDGVGVAPAPPAAPPPAPAPTPAAAPQPAAQAPPPPRPAPVPPQPAPAPVPSGAPSVHEVSERLGRVPSADELRQVRSSPLVRRMARENGVDLAQVGGSGIGGRVTKQDMLHYLESPAPAAAPQPAYRLEAPVAPPAPAVPVDGIPSMFPGERIEIVPMTTMRKKISEHMVMSKRTSAHVTTVFEIDMTNVMKLIAANKESFQQQHGVKLTLTPFIVRAVAGTLKQHPILNSAVVGDNVVYRKDVHMGVAVALDWGLVAPVVKHADEKNILGLCRAIADLAGRARSKQLKLDELQGGTFTITNPGVFGSLFGTPVINQPQVAILGVGTVAKRPVVVDDMIGIRSMAFFGLSFDHRVVDGADADRFMADLKKYLESYSAGML